MRECYTEFPTMKELETLLFRKLQEQFSAGMALATQDWPASVYRPSWAKDEKIGTGAFVTIVLVKSASIDIVDRCIL